jgi:tRNA threonylcarbamoyladenosine biosynthesis protein TsaB
MALRYCRFASKYCRMAGVRFAGDEGAEDSGACDTEVYDHTAVLILAVDTTTRAGSIAVTDADAVLAVVEGDRTRTHGERLPAEIEQALARAGARAGDLELLAVATGPGAFTGLRIGLAAVQGLAMVLSQPVIGVSAFDALASAAWPARSPRERILVTWMDAQRGEVFSAQYADNPADGDFPWQATGETLVEQPALLLRTLAPALQEGIAFVGDGALRYEADIARWSAGRARVLSDPGPLAPAIARIGHRRAAHGQAGLPHRLQPLYVRRPDAELERLRRANS